MVRAVPVILLVALGCHEDLGATGADASALGDAADADAASDDRVEDPCPAVAACPAAPATLARGAGLVPIDRCAFPLAVPAAATPSASELIDALPATVARVTLADVAADTNRAAAAVTAAQVPGDAAGIQHAFRWQAGDAAVAYWIPQGITGSFDGTDTGMVDGRRLALVSWYYKRELDTGSTVEKGVRIAIADVTDPANVRYRFALLVEPTGTLADPSWKAVPIHAGGLAWVGDRLYVPVTGSGFRVFDLSRILKVDSGDDRIGRGADGTYAAYAYAYAIPQIERIASTGACAPVFSFVALDRSSSPPSLITGEYDADAISGRLYRWPLAVGGALQRTTLDRTVPAGAWMMGESHVQGGLAHGSTWWLSSSRPAGGAGELVRAREAAASARLGWSDSPEDLAYDPQHDTVWSLTETVDARYVFEVSRASLVP